MPSWKFNSKKTKTEQPSSSPDVSSEPITMTSLRLQNLTHSSAASKIRHSMLATAMVDALGGPPEFHQRFSFPLITTMKPNNNFDLPPGVWTDDTSMMLCLARSLARYTPPVPEGQPTRPGGFDEGDQLAAYTSWREHGTLSAIGRCFDIGNTISRALSIYASHTTGGKDAKRVEAALREIQDELSGEECSGNGSLMRVLPIGLVYWQDEVVARSLARRSSITTHPNGMCMEACEVWTGMITRIMQHSANATQYTKFDLVEYLASFPYTNPTLRTALALPTGIPLAPSESEERESHYQKHHPILQIIARTQNTPKPPGTGFSKRLPHQKELSSSGYVLHTMVAALYCFFATETFEEGAIMAVNLGSDADTVGAVYAGLAGCWYSSETKDTPDVFWTPRVEKWRDDLVKRELVEEVADEIVELGRV